MKHCCELITEVVAESGSRFGYDPIYQEYSIQILDGFWVQVFFCPFCGTKTPDSQRSNYFTTVTKEEEDRLLKLVVDCATKSAILVRLGDPDWQHPKITEVLPLSSKPMSFTAGWLYKQLSSSAVLRINFDDEGAVLKISVEPRCTREADKPDPMAK